MRLARLVPLGLLLVLGLVTGCGDDTTGPEGPGPYPLDLSEPDSLMQQLLWSYKNREIDPYRELLAQDFVFRFQPGYVGPLGDSLDGTLDAIATATMFASSDVVDVRLAMTWLPPTDEMWDGEPAKRIVLSDMLLDVEQSNHVTLRVYGQTQHFYFRPGKAEFGENTGRYYLVGWQDVGSGGFARLGAAVEESTWGSIKVHFLTLLEASRGPREP